MQRKIRVASAARPQRRPHYSKLLHLPPADPNASRQQRRFHDRMRAKVAAHTEHGTAGRWRECMEPRT